MKHYIYIHKKLGTEEIFYVGKGSGNRAKTKYGRNIYWRRIVEKYNFEYEIIEYFETDTEAFEYEKLLIALLRETGEQLCNLAPGGEGGSSPEQLIQLHKQNIGSKRSAETKALLSKVLTGLEKKSGANSKRAIYKTIATNIETGEQIVMVGNKEIKAKGFTQSSVAQCLKGKRKQHKGHTFKQELRDD